MSELWAISENKTHGHLMKNVSGETVTFSTKDQALSYAEHAPLDRVVAIPYAPPCECGKVACIFGPSPFTEEIRPERVTRDSYRWWCYYCWRCDYDDI